MNSSKLTCTVVCGPVTMTVTQRKQWRQHAQRYQRGKEMLLLCARGKGEKGLLVSLGVDLGCREDLTLVSTSCLQHFCRNSDTTYSPNSTRGFFPAAWGEHWSGTAPGALRGISSHGQTLSVGLLCEPGVLSGTPRAPALSSTHVPGESSPSFLTLRVCPSTNCCLCWVIVYCESTAWKRVGSQTILGLYLPWHTPVIFTFLSLSDSGWEYQKLSLICLKFSFSTIPVKDRQMYFHIGCEEQ